MFAAEWAFLPEKIDPAFAPSAHLDNAMVFAGAVFAAPQYSDQCGDQGQGYQDGVPEPVGHQLQLEHGGIPKEDGAGAAGFLVDGVGHGKKCIALRATASYRKPRR